MIVSEQEKEEEETDREKVTLEMRLQADGIEHQWILCLIVFIH